MDAAVGRRARKAISRISSISWAASATRRSICSIATWRGAPTTGSRLIWEGEDGQTRFFTYRMLFVEVCKCANVLKGLGVRKGDAVAIFTPNLSEAIIAVLACFRIGALFNTVFSGFSARSLRDRLDSYQPKVILTADEGVRRGQRVPLKATVDEAIEGLPCVQTVIVVRRTGAPVAMREGRDRFWHDLMRPASPVCAPEPMEANEPGIVFYTSGTTGKPKGIVHAAMAFVVNNYVYTKYHMDHHPHDVLWCTADIGWLTMHIWGIVGALANGVTTVVFEGALDSSDAGALLPDRRSLPGEQDLHRADGHPHADAAR